MGTAQRRRMNIIDNLPEECISKIISFTTPKDACRSSLVHSVFRAAADSDAVWENFLPSDCRDIISQSPSPQLNSLRNKELFFRLCDYPILMANNNTSFSLDKHTGKKCYMIGAQGLIITWGDKPEHWKWTSIPKSRFPLVAELNQVRWLEVEGRIETNLLSSNTTYGVFFVFKFANASRKKGFLKQEVKLTVNQGNANESRKNVFLATGRYGPQDRWKEVEMGEFFNEHGDDRSVVCKLFNYGDVKRDLVVEGIKFRPKRSE